MVKKTHIIIAIIVIGVGIVGIWVIPSLFQSEEKRVKKQFHLLSGWVSKDSGENTFTMAHKTQNIGTLFADKCELTSNLDLLSGNYTPEEISSYAARGRLAFSELKLKFFDFDISFPETDVAKVTLTARLTGRLTTGEDVDETRELESLLNKVEKKWLFSRVEIIEVLKK
jgi:hypothetical protein